MHSAVLALGSNLGDRFKNIKTALNFVNSLPKTKVIKISSVYETEPVDVREKQNLYLNCCASLKTEFSPDILLGCFLGIEAAMGRKRSYKNAPRIIDIDLIFFDDLNVLKKNLIIPHPCWQGRKFVLIPLMDIFKDGNFKVFNILESLEKAPNMGIKKYCEADDLFNVIC